MKECRSRDRLVCAQHSAVAIGWTVSYSMITLLYTHYYSYLTSQLKLEKHGFTNSPSMVFFFFLFSSFFFLLLHLQDRLQILTETTEVLNRQLDTTRKDLEVMKRQRTFVESDSSQYKAALASMRYSLQIVHTMRNF